MKRLRSSDDLNSYGGDKGGVKDWGRRDDDDAALQRSSSSSLQRNSYYRPSDSGRKVVSSSTSRYDRLEDDREGSKLVRKRADYDVESYDRRKGYDRHREGNERGGVVTPSLRAGYGADQMYRSESFSGPRRDFPKGFRSERDRPKREGIAMSWRRFGGGKDGNDGAHSINETGRGSRIESKELGKSKSPQGFRDVKSPGWSKDSGKDVKSPGWSKDSGKDAKSPGWSKDSGKDAKSLGLSKDSGKDAKSPGWSKDSARDTKSPGWSKDSGSERSKSVEGKKYEDMHVESGGPGSEREEGELEPDPQPQVPLTKPDVQDKAAVKFKKSQREVNNESRVENNVSQGRASFLSVEKGDVSKVSSFEDKTEAGQSNKDVEDVYKNNDLPDYQDTTVQEAGGSRGENNINGENKVGNTVIDERREGSLDEGEDSTCADKLSLQEQGEDGGIDVDKKVDDIVMTENVEITVGSESPSKGKTTPSLKDKGKSIALLSSDSVHFTETNLEAENRPRDLSTSGDIEIEGSSTRGFQFFSTDPIKKPEKAEQCAHNRPKDDRLALELSLSLPNVLLPIGAQNTGQAPGSPSHGRSVQSFASSFRTNSDGFTASMSFSGSQQFTHNPSCSLTHNALDFDFEQSVKSKPLFQGVDWKALSLEENKNKEVPAHQGMSSRENDLLQQSQLSQGNSIGQAAVQNLRVKGESSKLPIALERHLSFNKHSSGAQGFVSYENGREYSTERRQLITEKDSGSLHRSNGPDGKDQLMVIGADFAESIITMIVSESVHTMARRFNDMTGMHVACVKEFVQEIISNPGKQWQLSALQKALQKRPDFSLDMLLNAHRTQLEILVALKTGLPDFLLQKYDIPISELAEIFLNMRCRNLNCRSVLPVDECDCKICARQSDFCRECMCLVCSKFDMAANTCSWVGCDVCLHWCHADCGLRESHIRNGQSATGPQGTTEMQFYCVACDHPSEMFGFVKEVFQNFLKDWTAENLSRELEYVRRIFRASQDERGKQLHGIAIRMLSKLANRTDLQGVRNHIMRFFTDTNSDRPGNISIESRKELPTKNQEGSSNGIAGSSLGAGWLKPVYPNKAPVLENPVKLLPDFESNRIDNKYTINMDFRKTALKEPMFDELESIVKIKQAEAKMFQTRAEDARRESEALKRISVSKSERIEEEYTSRITKLRLAEAEEMRKQKVEEMQALERSYQEYFNMKMRMETDIKDLLLKMEATRRNLAT